MSTPAWQAATPLPGTTTAWTPIRNWSSRSTQVADAMTTRPVLLSTAMTDHVANAVEGMTRNRSRNANGPLMGVDYTGSCPKKRGDDHATVAPQYLDPPSVRSTVFRRGASSVDGLSARAQGFLGLHEVLHVPLQLELIVTRLRQRRRRRRLVRRDAHLAVVLEPGSGRNQPAHRHVLLQAAQVIDLAGDRRFGEHARRLLERRC